MTKEFDRWVSAFQFSIDRKWVYLQYDAAGGTHLARVNLKSGSIEQLLQCEYVLSRFDLGRSGTVAARISTVNHTAEIFTMKGSEPMRLTDSNKAFFDDVKLGNKEKIPFLIADGTRVEAFVATPPDFAKGQRLPTILKNNGGPIGQLTWEYDFGAQYFAAKGYVIVEPNPRGSTGQGQSFVNAIYQAWGVTDYDDVMGAIDHAVEIGYADPNSHHGGWDPKFNKDYFVRIVNWFDQYSKPSTN